MIPLNFQQPTLTNLPEPTNPSNMLINPYSYSNRFEDNVRREAEKKKLKQLKKHSETCLKSKAKRKSKTKSKY